MDTCLYIVGTPIGNLADITFRAVEVLKNVDVIMAEDTRHSRRLMAHYAITTHMQSCHKFNEASRTESIVQRLAAGQAVAMITDAGMPCISDPGARMVAAVRQAGFKVVVIPGPSAVVSAVSLSGLCCSNFYFEGFLPHKSGKRAKRLAVLATFECPAVLYESPYRLLKLMGEIETNISPDRQVVVCRELTKKFEETLTGTPDDIRQHYESRTVKGELVVIISPAA